MPEFDYYMAISALKHAMLAIRDYSNGKTLGAPEALPNFAMEHLALYIDRHKSRVSAYRARLFSIQRASFSAIAMNGSACGPSNAAGGCPASEAWRISMSIGIHPRKGIERKGLTTGQTVTDSVETAG